MPIQIQLHDMSASTQFAPLGVLGYCSFAKRDEKVIYRREKCTKITLREGTGEQDKARLTR